MEFTVFDILVFVITILVTFLIGVVFAVREKLRKKNNPDYYFVAGRKSNLFPVTLSFVVTFQSSILMLGYPAEIYIYGTIVIYNIVGILFSFLFTAIFVVPVFYPLKLTSVYQYFHLRFRNNCLRYLAMSTGIFYSVFYMGTVTYGTCVALEVALGIPVWSTIIFYTMVTAIYTSVGGIKAVMWTDVFQFFVMVTGILAVIIKGTIDAGGPQYVVNLAKSRLDISEIGIDPRIRYTMWNLCIGTIPIWLYTSYMQPAMQRVYSTRNIKSARYLYVLTAPVYSAVLVLICIEGTVMFAYHVSKNCDILEGGVVQNVNALVPFTVFQLFRNQPGLSGLFIAALSSAALSTLSSCLSSLSAIVYTDVIRVRHPNISEASGTKISKLVVLLFGIIAMGMTFLISALPGTVMALFRKFMASLDGPTCGVFLLSTMFRRATTKGVFTGAIVGMAFPLWMNLGRLFSNLPSDPRLPSGPTNNCDIYTAFNSSYTHMYTAVANFSQSNTSVQIETQEYGKEENVSALHDLYSISYAWLSLCGGLVTLLVGIVVSLLTKRQNNVDERCIFSFRKHILEEFTGTSKEQSKEENSETKSFLNKNTEF